MDSMGRGRVIWRSFFPMAPVKLQSICNSNFDSEAWSFEIDVWRLSRTATETHLAHQTLNWTPKSESVKDPSYLPKVHPQILTANAVVRGVLMRFRVYNLRFKVQLDCTFCAQPFLHCQLRSTACKSEYFAEVYTIKLATIQLKPLFVNVNSTSPRLCRVLDLARWPVLAGCTIDFY